MWRNIFKSMCRNLGQGEQKYIIVTKTRIKRLNLKKWLGYKFIITSAWQPGCHEMTKGHVFIEWCVEWYISRLAQNSLNSWDHHQFNSVFIPSQKIPISHCNNFSYDIKAYSPFCWSLTHFVQTSGMHLDSSFFIVNIIDSLHLDFRHLPVGCWDSIAHLPYCPIPSLR